MGSEGAEREEKKQKKRRVRNLASLPRLVYESGGRDGTRSGDVGKRSSLWGYPRRKWCEAVGGEGTRRSRIGREVKDVEA